VEDEIQDMILVLLRLLAIGDLENKNSNPIRRGIDTAFKPAILGFPVGFHAD